MLEVGKTYTTANGERVGPMGQHSDNRLVTAFLPGRTERRSWWKETGKRYVTDPEHDLIAEWTNGPVRTVTRREVVAGSYGRVRVGRVVNIPDCTNPDVPPDVAVSLAMDDAEYTSGELRAAAAVLLELAGALE